MKPSDYQVAMGMNTEINANSKRLYPVTPSPYSPTFRDAVPVTRASKRARMTLDLPALTPESNPSTPLLYPSDGFSSPLSSPPDSLLALPTPVNQNSRLVCLMYEPGDLRFDVAGIEGPRTLKAKQCKTKTRPTRAPGVVEFTIADGDLRSQPPPGAKLLALVEDAKSSQRLPKLYQSGVFRLVDGKWFAPQICSSCQERGKQCNRMSPCSACVFSTIPCSRSLNMCLVRMNKRSLTAINLEPPLCLLGSPTEGPLMHSRIFQNVDGSWSVSPATAVSCQVGGKDRKKSQAREVGQATDFLSRTSYIIDETSSPEDEPKSQSYRGKKRKAYDAGFVPDEEHHESKDQEVQDCEPPRQAIVKRSKTHSATLKRNALNKNLANVQQDKPKPYGKPLVWAAKRQQLCEVLPYYRAYQSAAYTSGGFVHSFMCDKEVGIRDKFDDEILIARVGGGKMLDENGNMVQGKDQEKSRLALCFKRNVEMKKPLVLIAGEGNSICPTKLPHYYNVMDWFHVTDVWCELLNGFKTWMVRLEKTNLLERSWWSPKNAPPRLRAVSEAETIAVTSKQCELCGNHSKEIYKDGWTCLSTQCRGFFKFENGFDEATLDYNNAFLEQRTKYAGPDPGSLTPPLPTEEHTVKYLYGIEHICKQGIVCPKCGCCSRRIQWCQWACENSDCDFTHSPTQRIVPISQAVVESTHAKRKSEFVGEEIRSCIMPKGLYDVTEYIIPGTKDEPIGFVRHFKSNGVINSQADGPNDLFRQMQQEDFGLRRNPVRHAGKYVEMVTAHFAANWGATYKYGVAQISKGFNEAPPVIIKAVKRLTWAGEQAVAERFEGFHPFNELLSIGYMEGQHIGYHDDGEKELGPTVATLSLGANAVMAFRPKLKSAIEGNRKKPSKSAPASKPDILRLKLEHGDIVVMHGREIQSLYEHAVDPTGPLRFALTCRYINPNLMTTDTDRTHAAVAGTLPPESEQYAYDGDINAVEVSEVEPKCEIAGLLETIKAKYRTGEIGKTGLGEILAQVHTLMA